MSLAQHDIDALISRIRSEAAWAEPAAHAPTSSVGAGTLMQLPASDELEQTLRRENAMLHARDFFLLPAEKFISFAYRQILLRPVDEEGLRYSLNRLAQGGSRLAIVRALQRSAEGRAAGIAVRGMQMAPLLHGLDFIARKIPGVPGVTRMISYLEKRYLGTISEIRREQQSRIKAYLDIIRFVESWRSPLETQSGRTVVLERELAQTREQVQSLEQEVRLMRADHLYARHAAPILPTAEALTAPSATNHVRADIDAYYVAFEDANRGTKDSFTGKLSAYAFLLDSLKKPSELALLDIGCGRGELLDHLKEAGINARGVDTNQVMVALCAQAGHQVIRADALSLLQSLPDNSLAAITGFHIIEHLPFETLFDIFAQCYRVLAPGGFILFETPNPENILVGSHTFYHDFTHQNPITPTAVQFLSRYHNFIDQQIIRSSPYPASARLPGDDLVTERINGLTCGPQDFALVAFKPALTERA